jgi:hypothetical protein
MAPAGVLATGVAHGTCRCACAGLLSYLVPLIISLSNLLFVSLDIYIVKISILYEISYQNQVLLYKVLEVFNYVTLASMP